jgi:upstream activation factor subunit UAF30
MVNLNKFKEYLQEQLKTADIYTMSVKTLRKRVEEAFEVNLKEDSKEFEKFVLALVEDAMKIDNGVKKEDYNNKTIKIESQNATSNVKLESQSDKSPTIKIESKSDKSPTIKIESQITKSRTIKVESPTNQNDSKVIKSAKNKTNPTTDEEEARKKLKKQELSDAALAESLSASSSRSLRHSRPPQIPVSKSKSKKPVKISGEKTKLFNVPHPLKDFLGKDLITKPEIISKLVEYVETNNLKDPEDDVYVLIDSKLLEIVGEKRVHLYKLLKKFHKLIDCSGGLSNGNKAFNKLLDLSPQLSNVLQEPRLSRPQIVKRLWDYIRLFKLQVIFLMIFRIQRISS